MFSNETIRKLREIHIYNAYTVQIEGESMRKRMGMTE